MNGAPPHPDRVLLERLALGQLQGGEERIAREHVDGCAECLGVLKAAGGSDETQPDVMAPEPERAAALDETLPSSADAVPLPGTLALRRGDQLGRFVVLDVLGAGGMGVVLSAYDPQLDRKVAVKMLKAASVESRDTEASRARLMREAQALARLAHPNVVSVFEVGAVGDQIFIAMEYVPGRTLSGWLKERPRRWQEVLALICAAGRGLAAAHHAHLIHRDFKPDNVLVGQDERPRVSDFGLVGREEPIGAPLPAPAQEETAQPHRSSLQLPITTSGTVLGTPAYMAPEQFLGAQTIDARADQFAFAVVLWEALYGQPPFEGTNYFALQKNVLSGKLIPPPAEAQVPAWVRQVVMRGLAVDPKDRYASMEDLLRELERAPQKRQRWRYGAGGVAALALAAAGATFAVSQQRSLCSGAAGKLEGVWDEQVKGEVEGRIRALDKPWAAEAAGIVGGRMGTYAADWAAMFQETCAATRIRGEQSESVMSLRMICLDKRLQEVRALTRLLEQGDDSVLAGSVDAVHALSSLNGCADIALLTAPVSLPGDKETRSRIEAVEGRVAEAKALHDAGKYAEALEIAEEAAGAARDIGYAPLLAEALRWRGWLLNQTSKYKEGEQSLREAVNAADAGRADEERMRAMLRLEWAVGRSQGRFDEGLQWGRAGESLLRRIGGNDELEMELHNMTGAVLMAQGKYLQALAQFQRALQLSDRVLGAQHPQRARILGNVGAAHLQLGNREEALELNQQALAIVESSLGKDHPSTAPMHQNLGFLLRDAHDLDQALFHARAAVRTYEQAQGSGHANVADATDILVTVLQAQGKYQEALERAQKTVEIRQALAAEHPSLGWSYENVGEAYLGLKQYPKAIEALEHSLNLREPNGVPDSELAEARFALAQALWLSGGDTRRSRALAVKARDGYASSGDKEHVAEVEKWLQERPEEQ